MSKAELKREQSTLKTELRNFFFCLNRAKVIPDFSVLSQVQEGLDQDSKNGITLPWKYTLEKVELDLDIGQIAWPPGSTKLVCILDLDISGDICLPSPVSRGKAVSAASQARQLGDFVSPCGSPCCVIDKLAANLQFQAQCSGKLIWQQFWHFDRHITGVGSAESLELHPLFHFHFGGHRLADARASNRSAWGQLLELHAPRIAHPPLDFILLIDFVLANFAGAKWRHLATQEKEYLKIVESAQRRFWGPYNGALSDFLGGSYLHGTDHVALKLWPNLVRCSR